MNKELALENLINYSFNLQINMNDTFHYACSDVCEIENEDALDLLPFINDYGFDALIAYEAIKRGYNPDIPQHVTESFLKVKDLLLSQMTCDENFLVNLNYKLKKEAQQIKMYGGVLSFKFVKPTLWEKLKGQNHYTCVCSCTNTQVKGYGQHMSAAEENFKQKLRG